LLLAMGVTHAEQEEEPDGLSGPGRIAAAAALVLALLALGWILFGGNDDYVIKARFQAATQMVKGNLVQIGGRPVGTVDKISLTDDGQAELELRIDAEHAPLREGTQATLRIASLSGVVNRYVDLRIPPAGGDDIPEGGVITAQNTTSAVDLDQLFNLFDKRTRRGLSNVIRGFGATYRGKGAWQNAGWEYLNPSLVGAQRLFREVNRDTPMLRRFLVESSNLFTDVAERRTDLSKLVDRLATTTGAIAQEDTSLAKAIAALPPFMRRANTTFVNLRSTLDTLDPLVAESKPVAPKLRRVLAELRPFARDATPTVRDLADIVRRKGKDNDLLELSKSTLPFRDIAIGPVQANGAEREGSFPTSTKSLSRQRKQLAFFRPYSVDFTGWLDDFSHSGIYDANGSASRSATSVNAFSSVGGVLQPIPPALREEIFNAVVRRGQNNRCPGSIERGQVWKPSPDFNCDPSQVPPGK
jgi:phospholipid/cholesterol/gamma-HCH transport system substrate-binding protein